MAGTDATVAIYWDFENVHACLVDDADGDGAYRASRFKVQEPVVDIDPVTEYAATFGRVVVNRAYANWQYFGRYRDELQAHAIDLVQLFPLAGSKNGADIRLVLDVVEDLQQHPHLTHVIVVASDSDYTSLAQRCRKHGRYFLGVGTDRTASSYQFACDEFRRYRDLAGSLAAQAARAPEDAAREVAPLEDAGELVVRAIRRLAAGSGESWVRKAGLRPLLKRLDPTFDESGFGCPTFTELLRALEVAGYIAERPGEHDHEVAVRADLQRPAQQRTIHQGTAREGGGAEPWVPELPGLGREVAGLPDAPGGALDTAGLAGAGTGQAGPWQPPASASAVLIERQLRRRGLRLPASRRVLWELPRLIVAAFDALPDGTAASFEDLRLAVEEQAATEPGATEPGGTAGTAVQEADFNKVKSILLHARAFTLLGRDRGISLQVPDPARLRALIVGQLLRHLADPGDEEPAVLAEAFFGPSASQEQQELVAAVLQAVPPDLPADPAADDLAPAGPDTVLLPGPPTSPDAVLLPGAPASLPGPPASLPGPPASLPGPPAAPAAVLADQFLDV
jgi:hypothetical protein